MNEHSIYFSRNKNILPLLLVVLLVILFLFNGSDALSEPSGQIDEEKLKEILSQRPINNNQKMQVRDFFYKSFEAGFRKEDLWADTKFNPQAQRKITSCMADDITETIWNSKRFQLDPDTVRDVLDDQQLMRPIIIKCMLVGAKAQMDTQNGVSNEAAQTMEVSDLLLDYTGMAGKDVRVKGFLMTAGNVNLLYEKRGAMIFVAVDTSKLSRNERKRLLKGCSQGCTITIDGTVGDVLFQKGITATKLN